MKIEGVNTSNRRFVQGALLLNVPAGCVNLGEDGIKHIYVRSRGTGVRCSYISGQSIKAKIKDILEEKGQKLSIPKIVKESGKKNTPTTSCNPFEYLDDDLFGYMNVIPADDKDKIDEDNKGTTRASPFKISYFIGKEGDIKEDYGVKQNGAYIKDGELTTMPLTGESRRFAATQYSGCFIIDLNCAGRFFRKNISGYKNISDTFPVEKYNDIILQNNGREIVLKPDIRTQRVQVLIEALPYITGGAKLATIYTDIAPKFVIYCITDVANNLFQEIASPFDNFNISALRDGIEDYVEHIKSDIYVAKKHGFLDEYADELKKFIKEFNECGKGTKIICNEDLSGINEITKKFSSEVLSKIYFTVPGI